MKKHDADQGKNSQECWHCKKEVNLNDDKYYFFMPTEEVLCEKCCEREGIDEDGFKIDADQELSPGVVKSINRLIIFICVSAITVALLLLIIL